MRRRAGWRQAAYRSRPFAPRSSSGRAAPSFETIVALVDRLPVMVAPRWVSTPTQPIALTDIVSYLAGVAGREETFGEAFDVGGPEVMTLPRDDRAGRPPARQATG